MYGSPPPIRFSTIARAAPCNMRCDRLTALGWSRIETVDDDLGRSAAGGVARAGFDRMVAEVCLGKVGAGFRCYWRWKSRPQGGRPQIDTELRGFIRRMSVENPLWGAPRIHGELLTLPRRRRRSLRHAL